MCLSYISRRTFESYSITISLQYIVSDNSFLNSAQDIKAVTALPEKHLMQSNKSNQQRQASNKTELSTGSLGAVVCCLQKTK